MADTNRYARIIERIFLDRFRPGMTQVPFEREEIVRIARKLKIELPKNLGDVIYSFRYRTDLPKKIRVHAPPGHSWMIRPAGRAQYCFVAASVTYVTPNRLIAETKAPDATPGVIEMYAMTDEQALLAKVRYNRLIDIFTGVTCYSLQSHLRTSVSGMGQVETDELYVGVDRRGAHYILPVQAKGGRDKLNMVQIEQDFAVCNTKFSSLICWPVAAQFLDESLIALFLFERTDQGIAISAERHYRLVPPESMSPADLEDYRNRTLD